MKRTKIFFIKFALLFIVPLFIIAAAAPGRCDSCISRVGVSKNVLPADGESTLDLSFTIFCPGKVDFVFTSSILDCKKDSCGKIVFPSGFSPNEDSMSTVHYQAPEIVPSAGLPDKVPISIYVRMPQRKEYRSTTIYLFPKAKELTLGAGLKKKKCPDGESYDQRLGKCRAFCKRNETFDYKLKKCVPRCPKGQVMDERLGECRKKCKDGKRYDYKNKICRHPCPPDQTFDSKLGKCRVRCPDGERYDHGLGKCRHLCPPGQSFDKKIGKCRSHCPPEEVFDYSKGICRPQWMEQQKWKVIAGKGAGTELGPGDFIEPPKGAGVGIMRIGGPENGAVFIVWEPTRVPSVVRIPPPEGKDIDYMKILFSGPILNKIKGLLKGNKYCVETENAVASCLGTAYQIITSPSGDQITVLEGVVNVLPKKLPKGLISLVAGESIKIDRYGTKKTLISNAEYANLSETFGRMFGSSPEIHKAPESNDTWTPIGGQQELLEPESKRGASDETGWDSLQPKKPLRRQNDSRALQDEPLTTQENDSSY